MKIFTQSKLLRLFKFTQRINEQRHLYAIRTAFISTMPVMIVGAFASAINKLPIPSFQNSMVIFFGKSWDLVGDLIISSTTKLTTIMIVFAICTNLTKWYNSLHHGQSPATICGMVGIACYFAVSLPMSTLAAFPFSVTSSTGIFIGIIVALVVTEVFVKFTNTQRMNRLLTDDPSLAIPQAFAAVMPAAGLILFFVALRAILSRLGVSQGIGQLFSQALAAPFENLGNSITTGQLYTIFSQIMWLFGIHGVNVLASVSDTNFLPAATENIAAAAAGLAPPNLVTSTVFDAFISVGGSGATLALLIAIITYGRTRNNRTLVRYALPTSIFNINEPLIYGLPLVMNPIYAIPFVITPVVMFATTTLAMYTGLVPLTCNAVSWATPVFVSGYLATGSWAGSLLQLFNLALAVLIYSPFVRFSELVARFQFDQAYVSLCNIITTDYSNARGLVRRPDEIGIAARRLASQLSSAIPNGEMFLNYQPIINARSNSLHSVEALLRWRHPLHGLINPMASVALAEEIGYIGSLGLWVVETAVIQRAEWTKQGLPAFHISVNASTYQLNTPNFHEQVRLILQKYGVPASQLQIEITETAALIESEATRGNLARLHDMGVSLAMDDFGVGHSSLIYLRTQPISTLKLDAALTRDVVHQPANLDLISTIVDLCELMNVEMIAEVVESDRQLNMLMGIGVHLIQGYLYSLPLDGDKIPGYLNSLEHETSHRTGGEA